MKWNKKIKSAPMLALRILNLVVVYELTISPAITLAETANVTNTATDIMNAASGLLGQNQQQQQMQMKVQQQQSQIKAIVPEISADSLFPQCKMLPAKANHISGICAEPISSPQEYQMVTSQFAMVAQQNQNAYSTFMTSGLKLGSNVGRQCIDEQNKLLQAKLEQRAKSIQGFITQVENQNELFKNEAKKRLNALADINGELEGTDGQSKSNKARDFSIFLNNPNCKAVIAQDTVNSGKIGLRGLRSNVEGSGLKEAQKIITSRDAIEKDIRAQADGVKTYLQQNGAAGVKAFTTKEGLNLISTSSTYFDNKSVLSGGLVSKAIDISTKYDNLDKEFKTVDLAGSSNNDTALAVEEMKNQVDRKKREDMSECLYDNKTVTPIDIASLNFEQLGSKSQTTTKNFRDELLNLKANRENLSPDDMLIEIKKLEAKYTNSVTVKLNSSYKGQTTNKDWLVSDIFEGQKKKCSNFMDQKLTGVKYSKNEKYKKAYELISNYEKLNNSVANDVSSSMLNRALNCEGIAYSPSPDTCNAKNGKLDMTSSNFCLKQSTECATNLQACYSLADKVVKSKEVLMDKIALDHNNAVKIYMAKQDALLKNIGNQYVVQAQALQSYFPGSKFDLPDGENAFLLEIPQEEMNEFGVPIVKSEDYLKQLTEKLKKVQAEIVKQNTSINTVVTERIAHLEQVYGTEAEYWQSVADKCQGNMLAYKAQIQKQNDDAAKAAAEAQGHFAEFCGKANLISVTPGCDDEAESLSESAEKVANRLSVSDKNRITEIKKYCRGSKLDLENKVTPELVSEWCFGSKGASYDACKSYKKEYDLKKAAAGTGPAIAFNGPNSYVDAELKYIEIVKSSTTSSVVGENDFVSCNSVNNGSGDPKNMIDQFLKEFGKGSGTGNI